MRGDFNADFSLICSQTEVIRALFQTGQHLYFEIFIGGGFIKGDFSSAAEPNSPKCAFPCEGRHAQVTSAGRRERLGRDLQPLPAPTRTLRVLPVDSRGKRWCFDLCCHTFAPPNFVRGGRGDRGLSLISRYCEIGLSSRAPECGVGGGGASGANPRYLRFETPPQQILGLEKKT